VAHSGHLAQGGTPPGGNRLTLPQIFGVTAFWAIYYAVDLESPGDEERRAKGEVRT